jgi:SagB-type dehydrogenase family enzyme
VLNSASFKSAALVHLSGANMRGACVKESIGEKFVDHTKLKRGDTFPVGKRVPAFKVYASPLETVRLPAPKLKGGAGLWSVVAARRSQAPEIGSSVTISEVAQLLWAAQGITGERPNGSNLPFRTTPSPSGAYPLEAYLITHNVTDTFAGIYHYVVREHQLEQVRIGDVSKDLTGVMIGDASIEVSAAALVLTGVSERTVTAHGERGYRHLYLEAGFAAQNVLLAGTALGLSVRASSTFFDDELATLLGLQNNRELPLIVILIGR